MFLFVRKRRVSPMAQAVSVNVHIRSIMCITWILDPAPVLALMISGTCARAGVVEGRMSRIYHDVLRQPPVPVARHHRCVQRDLAYPVTSRSTLQTTPYNNVND
eukprot:scpid41839/ scgid35703/ 